MARTSLAWGILGLGRIARAFASALPHSRTGRLVAVASRDPDRSCGFGREFGVAAAKCHLTYEALLADPAVEAVYIATCHPEHAQWAECAAAAGKHILCEKPLALRAADVERMVSAARRHDVFLMEAFMNRFHPHTAKLAELVRDGAIGELRLILGTFGSALRYDPDNRLFSKLLGGGAILDVGCYPVSMARFLAGAASGAPFLNPVRLTGSGTLAPTGVDDFATATLEFENGVTAQLATATRVQLENALHLFGTAGSLRTQYPWIPPKQGGPIDITLNRTGQPAEIVRVDCDRWLYSLEADAVAAHVDERQCPLLSWDDSLGNARTLDQWLAAVGVTY